MWGEVAGGSSLMVLPHHAIGNVQAEECLHDGELGTQEARSQDELSGCFPLRWEGSERWQL